MELYQLRTFITVAETGNLTHAAERLYTSQPAISAHIKALEEELDIKLFNRIPKGMQLTQNGKLLCQNAEQILEASNEMRLQAKIMQNKLSAKLKIGLNTDVNFLKLTNLVEQITSNYPEVKINLTDGISYELLEKTLRGSIDGTFFFGENKHQELAHIDLDEAEIVVAGANKWQHEILNEDIETLAKLPWIYPVRFCPYSAITDKLFSTTQNKPEWITDAASENSMNALIKSGAGIALIMKHEAQPWVDEGLISIWPQQSFKLPLRFAYLKKRENDPDIKVLSETVRQLFHVE